MKPTFLSCLALALVALPLVQSSRQKEDPERAIKKVLTDFHLAAAEGDGERYLGYLAPDAVFFGTDASERWTYDEYVKRLEPVFEQGISFENVPVEQNVFVSERGDFAWFDEKLEKPKYGEMRGTGVLRRTDDGWKVVQFHLTFPIPNEITQDVVKMIRATKRK